MTDGRAFWKMSGSGNDFVFFDARDEPPGALETPEAIGALCDRRNGVGADGVVFVERDPVHAFGIRYFNRDGSLAELCGNASLCSVTLALELGIVGDAGDFTFQTSSGPLTGRLVSGQPEIDATRVTEYQPAFATALRTGERRVGYARVGVPHLVVLVDDVSAVDVGGRGRELRHLRALSHGANANFVSAEGGRWRMRTYERGVEEETLACGTGAVATSAMLADWGLASAPIRIATSSGRDLVVGFRAAEGGRDRIPSLRGEGRVVYRGRLGDIPGATL
jgi:diaminopimelate epimerase